MVDLDGKSIGVKPSRKIQADAGRKAVLQVIANKLDLKFVSDACAHELLSAVVTHVAANAQREVLDDEDNIAAVHAFGAAYLLGHVNEAAIVELMEKMGRKPEYVRRRGQGSKSLTARARQDVVGVLIGRSGSSVKDSWGDKMVGVLADRVREHLRRDGVCEGLLAIAARYSAEEIGAAAGKPTSARAAEQNLVGREGHLKCLDECLQGFRSGRSGLVGISGSPGIGKSALAETWAAHVAKQGGFPDGYLVINFHGYSSQRLRPDEVAEQLLADMGVKDIPASPSGRTRQLALRLSARRFFVLFDNVFTEDDVRDLLPRKLSSFVIVTSRKKLEGLSISHEAKLIKLAKLDDQDAENFIRQAAGKSRAVSDPMEIKRIAKVCSGLPLALRVVARRLETDAGLTLAQMADDLKSEENRLQALETSDKATSPRAVFATSYNQLSSLERKLFRSLSLRSSQEIDAYAVSLLGDIDMKRARNIVLRLKSVGLVEERRSRFDVHDLIYEFSGELCEEHDLPEMQRATIERLTISYYDCVNYAFDEKNPRNPMVDADAVERLLGQPKQPGKRAVDRYAKAPEGSGGNPTRWFEAERANLVDLVKRACKADPPMPAAAQLAFSLFYFLESGGHWVDWQAVNEAGYALAQRMNARDGREAQAGLLRNMGRWHFVQVRDLQDALRDESGSRLVVDVLTESRQAVDYFEQSFQTYQELCADQPSSAAIHRRAAVVRRELADATLAQAKLDLKPRSFTRALRAYLEARDLFESFDDALASRNALASLDVSLSEVYRHLKRYNDAEQCLESALEFAGDRRSDGSFIHPRTKGYAELRYAELEVARENNQAALDRFDNAIGAFHEDSNEIAEARTLAHKGRLLAKDATHSSAAASAFRASLDILGRLESVEADVARAWLQEVSDEV